ncbi:DUF995 domain-containing protein [Aestuariivirga litoralis]|uniref:DUF995 domain-containing protein n=1 Tax=Aestuariivirga litoralis TaxID=2650924 RepID=UPI0018C671C4|nr:DUF995 domain-containing protein [Aestuariivirga litoralis]MBG1231022.1 DUF995 domain-containing protein [Aestuariivirga litoralis]
MTKYVGLVVAAGILSGCASMNVFKDSSSDTTAAPNLAPVNPPMQNAGGLTSGQIKSLLSGKSWRWKGPKNSGVTLYASDGTSLVEVTGKGTTQGRWEAKDGQLCESFSPAPFLPQGVPMTCQPITGSGGAYLVGQANFTLAS